MAQQIFVDLTSAPDDRGAAITHVDVTVDGGETWERYPYPGALPASILSAAQVGQTVQIAAVNAGGRAQPSLGKSIASIDTINVPVSLSSGVTSIAFDLDTIQPPDAPTTWEHTLLAPGAGQTLVDPTFTLSGIGTDIVTGEYIVRRTPSAGNLENLVFQVTVVEPSLSVLNGNVTLVVGADDPAAADVTLTINDPGGPNDGEVIVVNIGDLDAIEPAAGQDPSRVLFVTDGVIARQQGTGDLSEGDVVEIVAPPQPVQWSGPAVPIASQWFIDGEATDLTADTYTVPAGVTGVLTRAWTDGTTTVLSNSLTIVEAVVGVSPYTFIERGFSPLIGNNNAQTIHTLVAAPVARRIVVQTATGYFNTIQPDPLSEQVCTIAGVEASQHFAAIGFVEAGFVWIADIPADVGGAIVMTRSDGLNNGNRIAYQIGAIPPDATLGAPVVVSNIASNGTADVSQPVAANSAIIVGSVHDRDETVRTITWSAGIDAATTAYGSTPNVQHSLGYDEGPLPAGTYEAIATVSGELNSRTDTFYSIEIVPGA